MFQKLVSHNEDLNRLVDCGYAVAFDSNYLIIRDIPYLDERGELQTGAIVAKLVYIDPERVSQEDHQIFFAGSVPYGLDGKLIPNLGGGPTQLILSEACQDVVVQRSFSNKPKDTGQFPDFFEKIESYVGIISGPAMAKHNADPYTFRAVTDIVPDTVFKFNDTLTSRAEIGDLAARFHDDVVAVIGCGGTGSYILDFLVKTRVKEIRAFDPDGFHIHNAYRAPGKVDDAEFGRPKAEVFQSRYENFRTGLLCKKKFIDASSEDELRGVTFAFVCVDKGTARAGIFELLLRLKIPFIDVGMGLDRSRGALDGLLRVTYYSADHGERVRDLNLADLHDPQANLYRANIQISELNALNACLAVIRFKQLRGFYFEEVPNYHLLFGVGDLATAGESELP